MYEFEIVNIYTNEHHVICAHSIEEMKRTRTGFDWNVWDIIHVDFIEWGGIRK